MYRAIHRVGTRALCFAFVIFTFQLTTYIQFLKSDKGEKNDF